MAVYHKHLTQRVPSDPHWAVNCTAYCGAMLINDSTLGGLNGITGRWVREHSNEPNPSAASPGLNISQIIIVARSLHVPLQDKTTESWTELLRHVSRGQRVLLSIDYGELPNEFKCQPGGDFGHGVVVYANPTGGTIEASDPLCAKAKVYPEEVIHDAARVFARQTGVQNGLRWCVSRPVPQVK